MKPEIDKNMKILMGRGDEKSAAAEITTADKKTISDAYMQLFLGLSGINWSRGKTLGAAWYTAVNQISAMIGTRDKNNPAALYLGRVHASAKIKWAQMAMTHAARNDNISISRDAKSEWDRECAGKIHAAMDTINQMVAKMAAPRDATAQKPVATATPAATNAPVKSPGAPMVTSVRPRPPAPNQFIDAQKLMQYIIMRNQNQNTRNR